MSNNLFSIYPPHHKIKPNTYILKNRYKINFVLLLMCQKHADTKLTDTVERRKFV